MVSQADLPAGAPAWREPWRTGGLSTVLANPHVLGVLVGGEIRYRYHGTWLGGFWSYARPLSLFFVYYFVIGVLLGFSRYPNFGIYVFCGMLVLQLFSSALVDGTRSLAKNQGLLRRVNIPSENIPIAAVIAGFVKQRPSMLILLVATVLTGWRPIHVTALPYAVGGLVILTIFTSGLVLITSVANMYVKDIQYAVETIVLLVRWGSPTIYPAALVLAKFGYPFYLVYMSNPVTVAMVGLRMAFWEPTVPQSAWTKIPPLPLASLLIAMAISGATFVVGVWLMHRTEHRVASRIQWNS
jgi:ABC-2 type transport system permease protein